MPARPFLFEQSQAGCFHVVNRVYDRNFLLDPDGKELLVKLLRAYEGGCMLCEIQRADCPDR